MSLKEIGVGIVLPIVLAVLGFVPYLLEKRGIRVPNWTVSTGGVIAIVGIVLLICCLLMWGLKQITSREVSLASCLSVGIAVFLGTISCVWWLGGWRIPNVTEYPISKPLEVITGRNFENEQVEVDGRRFDYCQFTNVKFVYHGLSEYTFVECKFSGTIQLVTENQSVLGYENLLKYLSREPGFIGGFAGVQDKTGHTLSRDREFPKQP